MSGALADAVRPRMKNDEGALQSFKSILAKGMQQGGSSADMKLCFLNTGDKMTVRINGLNKGEVKSKSLCEAFVGVYLDKNAVSPGRVSNSNSQTLVFIYDRAETRCAEDSSELDVGRQSFLIRTKEV